MYTNITSTRIYSKKKILHAGDSCNPHSCPFLKAVPEGDYHAAIALAEQHSTQNLKTLEQPALQPGWHLEQAGRAEAVEVSAA